MTTDPDAVEAVLNATADNDEDYVLIRDGEPAAAPVSHRRYQALQAVLDTQAASTDPDPADGES